MSQAEKWVGSDSRQLVAGSGPAAWGTCLESEEAGAWALAASGLGAVTVPATAAELEAWLNAYGSDWLVSREWPVVVAAWNHAQRGEGRELVALDRAWGREWRGHPWAEASLRVGRRQLSRLGPLRDVRVVQRLLAAVAAGEAAGWHPVVHGLLLSVFSLPLRQGLMHYATQTLSGLAGRVPVSAHLPEARRREILEGVTQSLVPALNRLLPAPAAGFLALA